MPAAVAEISPAMSPSWRPLDGPGSGELAERSWPSPWRKPESGAFLSHVALDNALGDEGALVEDEDPVVEDEGPFVARRRGSSGRRDWDELESSESPPEKLE